MLVSLSKIVRPLLSLTSFASLAALVVAGCSAAPDQPGVGADDVGTVAQADTTAKYGFPVCVSPGNVCLQWPGRPTPCAAGPIPYLPWRGTTSADVVSTPHLYLLHMGAYWSSTGASAMAQDRAAWRILATDPRFWTPVAEYGAPGTPIAPTLLFGSGVDTSVALPASGNVADAVVLNQVVADIASGAVPSPSAEPGIIYVVRLPTGVGTAACPVGGASCGSYHTWMMAGGVRANIAVIVGSNFENGTNPSVPTALERGQDIVISHEVYETVSDPAQTGWVFTTAFCGAAGMTEVADLCAGINQKPLDGFTLASSWSNAAVDCVGSGSLTTDDDAPCPSNQVWGTNGCACRPGTYWNATDGECEQRVVCSTPECICTRNGGYWANGRCIYW
jgi:hypothetical protein